MSSTHCHLNAFIILVVTLQFTDWSPFHVLRTLSKDNLLTMYVQPSYQKGMELEELGLCTRTYTETGITINLLQINTSACGGGHRSFEVSSIPSLTYRKLNSRSSFLVNFSYALCFRFILRFYCLSALSALSSAFCHNSLQTAPAPEVGMRLPARWLHTHIHKNLTNMGTPAVIAWQWRQHNQYFNALGPHF